MKPIDSLRRPVRGNDGFPHDGHPLIQRLRAVRGVLLPFEAEEVRRALADAAGDVVVDVSFDAVALYGSNEAALKRAAARVSGDRWKHLDAGPVEARTRSDPHRVAWMRVHLRCARRFGAEARHELVRRGGRTIGAQFSENVVTLAAIAPLAPLIGYADWLARQTDGKASVQCRLDEWRVEAPPPDAPRPCAA